MKIFFLRFTSVALFTLACSPVMAIDCGGKADPCGQPTGWNEFETVRLRMKQTGVNTPAQWFMQTSRANNDLQVEIDVPDPKVPQKGTIMMVEGLTLLTKGVGFVEGYEIDALDVPVLYIILTGKVLSRALPSGPGAVGVRHAVAHEDKKIGIKFATRSASGFISPPWSVSGKVVGNADGSHNFDLILRWTADNRAKVKRPLELSLVGQLIHNNDFKIDSNMSLIGWKVFGVGPIIETLEGSTRIDYGAKSMKSKPKTIADIRAALAIENSPGEPEPSLNFVGFWKEKCTESFGLRIKPANRPHMYTVTFCGPGGCGDETNERETFIKGDKRYNIVSATELQVGSPQSQSTYKKCSESMLP